MPLDGLRAWIGEVERKLGVRTRVFLVLTVIAIGGAGAGIYLAVDARENSVGEGDVQALQEKLEARIGGGAAGTGLAQLEAELKALRAQVEQLSGEGGGSGKGGGANGASGGEGKGAGAGNSSSEGTSGSSGTSGDSKARLGELLRQAEEASEKAEGK